MSRSQPAASRCLAPPFWVLWLGLILAPSSRAEYPAYQLHAVFPPGGRAGTTVEVELTGAELELAEGLWFDHPGLRAVKPEDADGPKFTVTIAPDVPLGAHDARVVGPLGVSNPRVFKVGQRPESSEAEPNNGPEEAQAIAIGQVVNGRINGNSDLDWFEFEGRQGRRVLARLEALGLDSRLDAELRLFDGQGAELDYRHGAPGREPLIDVVLPSDGTYRLEVRDVVYSGSPNHVYRLWVHDGPRVDLVRPLAVEAGRTELFELLGRNLDGERLDEGFEPNRPLERLQRTIAAPEVFEPLRSRDLPPSFEAGTPGFLFRFATERGVADPVVLSKAEAPVVLETEPNDHPDTGAVQEIALPADVSADFRTVADVDVYRFEAKQNETWRIEVLAHRIGSPADPYLVVQQVRDDGSVRDLNEADDQPNGATQNRFPTSTKDPGLNWKAPADGTYQIVVADLDNPQRFSPRSAYRLVIRKPRPDFRLYLTPSDFTKPNALTLRAGGRGLAYVVAERLEGFDAPIRVEPEALPDWLSAEPVVIGKGEAEAPVVFEADADAPNTVVDVSVRGTGLSGDRKELVALGDAKPPVLDEEPVRSAASGAVAWGPARNNVPPPARLTRGFLIAVRPQPAFRLSAEPRNVVVTQGEKFQLAASIERFEGFKGEVNLTVADQPNRMGGANAKIAGDATETTLELNVPGNVQPGMYTIRLQGTGKFPFAKTPDADKAAIDVIEPSNPITLTIRPK